MMIVQYLESEKDYNPRFYGMHSFQYEIERVTRRKLMLRPDDRVIIHGVLDDIRPPEDP